MCENYIMIMIMLELEVIHIQHDEQHPPPPPPPPNRNPSEGIQKWSKMMANNITIDRRNVEGIFHLI